MIWVKLGLGVGVICLFLYVFVGASGFRLTEVGRGDQPAPAAAAIKRGNYGQYLYGISDMTSENKKVAQFDPALPAQDDVVLAALRHLAQDEFGMVIGDEVQPAVETIHETNYVTFTMGSRKIFFELFRNSSGAVGTVHFWQGKV